MAQNTRMVLERIHAANTVIETAHEHVEYISKNLDALTEHSSILRSAHIKEILLSQARFLEQATAHMQSCDSAYINEQNDDVSLRGRMAEASIELDRKLRLTRESIRDLDSPETLQIYGLSEPPPRARHALVDYAKKSIQLLRAHPYQFSGEIGQIVDTRRVADMLEVILEPFESLVDEMSKEMDDLQEALQLRNQAIDDWTDVYQGVSNCLHGFFQLAQLGEHAHVFVPSYTRTSDLIKKS